MLVNKRMIYNMHTMRIKHTDTHIAYTSSSWTKNTYPTHCMDKHLVRIKHYHMVSPVS